jgi:hypothetical protein
MSSPRYACPCCRFATLPKAPPGTFELCPVCFWEDDNIQFEDENFEGGANPISLAEARANFLRIGAMSAQHLSRVRPPTAVEGEGRKK